MKILLALACLLSGWSGSGQSVPNVSTSARSMSGQFYVNALPKGGFQPPITVTNEADYIRLEPAYVSVSCERIKQTVWRELGYSGTWMHRAAMTIVPARSADENVTIVTERASDGWNYRVGLPDLLPRERYLKAIVQVVLSELANRRMTEKPAGIPVWLTEGLAFHLQCNSDTELLLDPPTYRANNQLLLQPRYVETRRFSELEKAHKILVGTTPLTFEQLSWPAPGQFEGAGAPHAKATAQLLTCQLLKLPDGPECMRNFIAALPDYLNWQLAFLRGFEPHFKRPLDVEKWWALETIEFAGRDLTQTWPFEESWAKLSAALIESVDIFTSTNELPKRSELTLPTIVREWEGEQKRNVLRRKVTELGALRLRVAPELMQLTEQYALALDTYLKQLDSTSATGANSHLDAGIGRYAQVKVLKRLAQLDAERDRLRPAAFNASADLATSKN